MFESIPPTDVVLLKNIMHDWGHEDCIKILQHCKEAIATKNAGGKVIIIDMVRGSADGDRKISEWKPYRTCSQCASTAWNGMSVSGRGSFLMLDWVTYKIMPVLGPYSVIEIYP
uniref:O-methyltransferase C-terminal domain-containing protein n=2 Tax=Aegilops tauschii subsp. strangulata TaxID=200361 RepID=A0A453J7Y8_AEGTS